MGRTPAATEFTGRTLHTRGGSAASLRLKHEVFPRESRADGGKTAHDMLRWLTTRGLLPRQIVTPDLLVEADE